MKTMVGNITIKIKPMVASSLVLLSIVAALSLTKPSYAATTDVTFDKSTQVAWFWDRGPYPHDYYRWHHWDRWYPEAGNGCHKRCLRNRWTGAVVRCEQICTR